MTQKYSVEKSPSPVYGARLELVYALIAHRGFESLLLRQIKRLNCEVHAVFLFVLPALRKNNKLPLFNCRSNKQREIFIYPFYCQTA